MTETSSSSTTYSLLPAVSQGCTHHNPKLAEALAEFQKELPSVGKHETAEAGRRGTYTYAGLDAVAGRVLPQLGRNGLAFTSATELTKEGRLVLVAQLLHISGEHIDAHFPIPITSDAQQMGSWLTYARRYCLLMLTGVHPGGEDDDGAAAVTAPTPATADRGAGTAGVAEALSKTVKELGDWPAQRQQPADSGYSRERGRRAVAQENEAPPPQESTEHVDEKAQVLASLAQELVKRNCSLDELKNQVYETARGERLLKGLVVNPWTGGMVQLSTVITHARKLVEDRLKEADGGEEGY